MLRLLTSMYYDDATVLDLQEAKGQGQIAFGLLARIVGQPFAAEKRQDMAATNTFLGLTHELGSAHRNGNMVLKPKEKLVTDIQTMANAALESDSLTPGEASKLRGKLGFASTGLYSMVGRACMRPLVQREFSDKAPWMLSRTLRAALNYILVLLRNLKPKILSIKPSERRLIVIASDAQADEATQLAAGLIAIHPAGREAMAAYAQYSEEILSCWSFSSAERKRGKNPIAICECAVVLFGLVQLKRFLRGADVIWFVDNTVALHSLCKGVSGSSALRRTVEAVHILRARFDVNIWHEYVRSKDNWSDGISREGWSDPLLENIARRYKTHKIELAQSTKWYRCDLQDVWTA